MAIYQIKLINDDIKLIDADNPEAIGKFVSKHDISRIVKSIQPIKDEHPTMRLNDDGTIAWSDEPSTDWWWKAVGISRFGAQNTYTGKRENGRPIVIFNGATFTPKESQQITNHSPDGFEWGYGGSGPAQLALAILLRETGDPKKSLKLYHKFLAEVISELPKDNWTLYSHNIKQWLNRRSK